MRAEFEAWTLIAMLAITGIILRRTYRRPGRSSLRSAVIATIPFLVIALPDCLNVEGQSTYRLWIIPCLCVVAITLFSHSARAVRLAAVGFAVASLALTLHADRLVHQGRYTTSHEYILVKITHPQAYHEVDAAMPEHAAREIRSRAVYEWHSLLTGLYRIVGANRY